jgi:hypothetical protein
MILALTERASLVFADLASIQPNVTAVLPDEPGL